MCLYGKKEKKKKQIQIHTPTKGERRSKSGFGFRSCCSSPRSESGFRGFSCGMPRTRPVESVSTNEGLKGTNLRRIDTTSWVSKIDLVLQIEINFFFRLRNIALEIYILVVYFLRWYSGPWKANIWALFYFN